jgi:pyrimidine operon attenuation protein/uracil phosphoribosyltransferase
MSNKLIINHSKVQIILKRLCSEIFELKKKHLNLKIIVIQPRGVAFWLALMKIFEQEFHEKLDFGLIDPTFYRDDIRLKEKLIIGNESRIDFEISNQPILLIDDVLFTGRTTRAAIDAIFDHGRPMWIKFMVLVNRYSERELPIEVNYQGIKIDSHLQQKIIVHSTIEGNIEIHLSHG